MEAAVDDDDDDDDDVGRWLGLGREHFRRQFTRRQSSY